MKREGKRGEGRREEGREGKETEEEGKGSEGGTFYFCCFLQGPDTWAASTEAQDKTI